MVLFYMRKKYFFTDQGKIPLAMITTMKKLKSGYINGTRVSLGNLNEFLSTSCITNLSFLGSAEDGRPDRLNPEVIFELNFFILILFFNFNIFVFYWLKNNVLFFVNFFFRFNSI